MLQQEKFQLGVRNFLPGRAVHHRESRSTSLEILKTQLEEAQHDWTQPGSREFKYRPPEIPARSLHSLELWWETGRGGQLPPSEAISRAHLELPQRLGQTQDATCLLHHPGLLSCWHVGGVAAPWFGECRKLCVPAGLSGRMV